DWKHQKLKPFELAHLALFYNGQMDEKTRSEYSIGKQEFTYISGEVRLLNDLDGELREDLRSGRHLPRIVDKALRLFNLRQVIMEVETSVMSKVSCTACKA
ncbi:hypothetical protein L9F63_016215, partial [Diploptera punctata]